MLLSLQPKEQDEELVCFYYDNHRTPGLVIRPAKVEIVFLKPRLFILQSVHRVDKCAHTDTHAHSIHTHLQCSHHTVIYCWSLRWTD